MTSRRESVLSLKPTVVLADTTTGPAEAIDQIRDAGIPLVVVDPAKGLDDVERRIDTVAEALGVPAAGTELKKRTESRIAAVQKTIPDHADGKKPRVAFLYLRGSASVYLLGGAESGASSLLEAAGAVDAGKASGLNNYFTAITSEALAKAAPDAILLMSKGLDSVGGMDGLVKIPGIAETPAGMDCRVRSDRRRRAADLRPAHRPGARRDRRAAAPEGRQGPVTTSYEERTGSCSPRRTPPCGRSESRRPQVPAQQSVRAHRRRLLSRCSPGVCSPPRSVRTPSPSGRPQLAPAPDRAGGQPLDRGRESVLERPAPPRRPRAPRRRLAGCAGALMQGVFGNPLAEPGVIGISAGAAVGAVASIALGLTFFSATGRSPSSRSSPVSPPSCSSIRSRAPAAGPRS
ncbi:Vitamin B12 import system permease protein BtuC [Streptomyces cyaneofuscatus]